MAEYTTPEKTVAAAEAADTLLAGKPLEFYWRATRLFMVLLVVLEAVVIIGGWFRYGHWAVEAVVGILVTFYLLRRWQVRLMTALVASFMAGVGTGLAVALVELIWYRHWWYVLDLIRRPVLMSLAMVVTSFLFYIVFQSLITRKKETTVKGGGIYGGKETSNRDF